MKSSDLQMDIIQRRAALLRRRHAILRAIRTDAVCAAVCLTLLALVFTQMPAPEVAVSGTSPYGSLIFASHAVGVVIGVLAFALGVCATLLCRHIHALGETERGHES